MLWGDITDLKGEPEETGRESEGWNENAHLSNEDVSVRPGEYMWNISGPGLTSALTEERERQRESQRDGFFASLVDVGAGQARRIFSAGRFKM